MSRLYIIFCCLYFGLVSPFVDIFTIQAIEPTARLFKDTSRMLDGIPTLICIAESARDQDGKAVVIFTWIGARQKVVAPMPETGIYPVSVFRYRVRKNERWQWIHETTYSDDTVVQTEVSR